MGADWCNMARPFMFAIGCIQARDCASSNCPSGVATMKRSRYRVIDVDDRAQRVHNFHKNTLGALKEMLEAAGLTHPHQLNRRHIVRRLSASQIKLADQIYPRVEINALIEGKPVEDPRLAAYWNRVSGASFFQPIDNDRFIKLRYSCAQIAKLPGRSQLERQTPHSLQRPIVDKCFLIAQNGQCQCQPASGDPRPATGNNRAARYQCHQR